MTQQNQNGRFMGPFFLVRCLIESWYQALCNSECTCDDVLNRRFANACKVGSDTAVPGAGPLLIDRCTRKTHEATYGCAVAVGVPAGHDCVADRCGEVTSKRVQGPHNNCQVIQSMHWRKAIKSPMQLIDRIAGIAELARKYNSFCCGAGSGNTVQRDIERLIHVRRRGNGGAQRCDEGRSIYAFAAMGQSGVPDRKVGGQFWPPGTDPAL